MIYALNHYNIMGIVTDYLVLQKRHEEQYGERTVVLIQVGSFYEIYGYDPTYCTTNESKIDKEGKVWQEAIGHAVELSVVLNSVLTHENGNEAYGINNPHKIGFPMIAYEKNRNTLLANDYVIVRVDQEKNAIKSPITRFVAEICSPTMQIDNIMPTRPTSNIACIYIEYQQGARTQTGVAPITDKEIKFDNFLITTGVAVVDVITGQNRVCEFYSKAEDQVHAVQELYRFLISHYPRELIIHIGDMPEHLSKHNDATPNPYVKYLDRVLELRRFDRLTVHVNEAPLDYKKIPYQVEFLNEIFTKKEQSQQQTGGIRLNIVQKRNEHIIEELGLERMNYGRIAYMILMQHCHSHNADIITKLSKPDLQWIDANKHLILTHNAIVQLDLIPDGGKVFRTQRKADIDSLMSVLDRNQTHLGRRLLHTLLQNPMSDPNDIQVYYDMVDEMLSQKIGDDPLWLSLERQLKELPDIARLQRKLLIKLITPKELAVLYKAYVKIIDIYITILRTNSPTLHKQMFAQEDAASFNQFISRYTNIFNFEALECCHIDASAESNSKWMEFVECPIRQGIYPELDQQARQLVIAETSLQQIIDHLNLFLARTSGKKLAFKKAKKKQGATKQDPTGTILTTTAAKATTLTNSAIDTNLCGVIQAMPYTSTERIITSDKISILCGQIDNIKMWMRQKLLSIYESFLEEIVNKYTFFIAVANLIAKIDLIHSYSKVSYRYNYHRPEIVIDDSDVSFLEAREIRHPIIERLVGGEYVTNDIYLGNGKIKEPTSPIEISDRTDGLILFGLNQSGKSSLSKAVALNIILAQIGCFTASHLRYKPYSKIITRLSGNDNIFRGESSFAIEMTELRTILRQADSSTLVVGDEVSRGTENISGAGITVSAILSLIEKKASFIFATHIHDIVDLPFIKEINISKLKICHLSVIKDPETGSLIYERKLKMNSGSPIYGVLVAESLELPRDFIDKAYEVVHYMMGTNQDIIKPVPSRYNKEVYVNSCAICHQNSYTVELHTHHIQEQHKADEKGLIGNMHMNKRDNLIILCRECHTNLHHNKQELETLTTATGKIVRMKPDLSKTDQPCPKHPEGIQVFNLPRLDSFRILPNATDIITI